MTNDESRNPQTPGKAARVRQMFAEIAPRYDFLNHALSLNIDKRWRRFVVKLLADRLRGAKPLALDLCCGTGDLAMELGRLAETVGVDFCHPMLQLSLPKVSRSAHAVSIIEADALRVPFADASFDVITIGFGLRNLESVEDGLREIFRLLKPGGRLAVLECSHPVMPVFRQLYQFYFLKILPRIGNAISGSSFAYQYLPDSVQNFPEQQRLAAMMRTVGFSGVTYYNLFGGVAAVHVGDKL